LALAARPEPALAPTTAAPTTTTPAPTALATTTIASSDALVSIPMDACIDYRQGGEDLPDMVEVIELTRLNVRITDLTNSA